jgi:hypothetical protein
MDIHRMFTQTFLKQAKAVLLIYDITDRDSFEGIKNR